MQRRHILQGAILSTTALALPGVANALCNPKAHAVAQSENVGGVGAYLNADDIAIDLVESETPLKQGNLAWVTIRNKSQETIKLSHISPGAITTQKGVYQLNASLSNNPLSLRSGGVYTFWLTPDDGSQALLSTKPSLGSIGAISPTSVKVSVFTQLESGSRVGTQRVQAFVS